MPGTDVSPQIRFGILRTRDLVELYFGGRMVVSEIQANFAIAAGASSSVMKADPRRIKYEIAITSADEVSAFDAQVGTFDAVAAGAGMFYNAPAGQTISIIRNWTTDMESVCRGQTVAPTLKNVVVTVRETFLTPLPVDE